MKEEQILVRITGQDRPGLTASVMGILSKYYEPIIKVLIFAPEFRMSNE